MTALLQLGRRFVADERGLAVTEYGVLLALVAVALVAILKAYGTQIKTWFGKATTDVTTATP